MNVSVCVLLIGTVYCVIPSQEKKLMIIKNESQAEQDRVHTFIVNKSNSVQNTVDSISTHSVDFPHQVSFIHIPILIFSQQLLFLYPDPN